MLTLEEKDADNFVVKFRDKKVFVSRDNNPYGYWEGYYQNKTQPECISKARFTTLQGLLERLELADKILSTQRPKIKYKKVKEGA